MREKGCKVSGSVVARGEDCHPNASRGSTQLAVGEARREEMINQLLLLQEQRSCLLFRPVS